MMNLLWRLSNVNLLGGLLFLLGFSFQFSLAATNIFFYLLVLICIFIFLKNIVFYQEQPWREVISSRLWQVLTLWVILLYVSISYSDADPSVLLEFARKYAKYLTTGVIGVVIALKLQQLKDLPKWFFLGLALGGVISFSLAIFNATTGLLNDAAQAGWLPTKYVVGNYWRSNEAFAYSLLMAIVSLYGICLFSKTRCWWHLSYSFIGLFGVFVVSQQRTGYVVFFVLMIWLIVTSLSKNKWRIPAVTSVLLFFGLVIMTENQVSDRIVLAKNEIKNCLSIDLLKQQDPAILGEACYSNSGLRALFYVGSIRKIKQSWLYGHGLADINIQTLALIGKQEKYYSTRTNNPHNEYLLQGIQLGVIGVALLVTLFSLSYWHAMQLTNCRRYLYGGIIVMYAVSCLFNSYLLDAAQGLFFAVILAFIIAECIHQKDMENT